MIKTMHINILVLAVAIALIVIFILRPGGETSPRPETKTATTTSGQVEGPLEPEGERVQTSEGLIYQDITFGTGETAQTGDKVSVHYIGRFEDGGIFDTSLRRQEPFTFTLGTGQVISGWDLGITGMNVGGLRELIIPPDLAYGEQERGPIPPGSTLIFTVELLEIQ